MIQVRVLKRHAQSVGLGVWKVGDTYFSPPKAAQDLVRSGFVEYVDPSEVRTKESPAMYQRRVIQVSANKVGVEAEEEPESKPYELSHKSGNWYFFTNGEKVLGKGSAAEMLGITVDELENLNVDSNPK